MSSKDKPRTPKEELQIYKEAPENEKLEVGQVFYVISAKWYRQWKDYVEHNEKDDTPKERPSCIDNSDIIERAKCDDGEVQIKINLQERYDYELVSESQWKLLHSWYGGGPPIRRKVISENDGKIKRVEVNLLHLEVLMTDKYGNPNEKTLKRINVSKTTKIGELKSLLTRLFDVDITTIRIWNYESPSSATLLDDINSTLAEEQIIYGQKLLVEKQLKDGTWPRSVKNAKVKKKETSKNLMNGVDKDKENINSVSIVQKGCCGLVNLGNTCFMNSALQCLSNTPFLNEYFIEGRYKNEINTKNPLGMKGAIAEVFGMLLKNMWSGEFESIAPKKFKHVLGKWAPQFEGFSQHDSQEFLGTLLDGLHEDLNRVSEKLYVELKESDGRPDNEVAKEAWENHLRRNRSIIVDLFQGQLKSTVKCPDCGKVSITFDPFMYLSLPLVQEHELWLEIAFFRDNDTATPMKYAVKVRKNGQILEIKEALSKLTNVEPERIALTHLQNLRLMPFYKNSQSIFSISSDYTLVAYEISKNNHPDLVHAKVVQRKKRTRPPLISYHELFGITFMVFFVPQETTGRQLYKMVWNRCKRFIRLPKSQSEQSKSNDDSTKNSNKESQQHPQSNNNDTNDTVNAENVIHSKSKIDIELNLCNLPFKLALVSSTGLECGVCKSNCTGCVVKPDDNPICLPRKDKVITLSIDWEQNMLDNFYDDEEAMSVTIHRTVSEKRENQKKPRTITLFDCLDLFTTQERLGPDDPWYCPKCKEHKQAFKKMELWKLPTILIIHFKRFRYTRYFREKLSDFVDFPIENLDLSKFVINPDEKFVKYDLFAVSNHMGGLGGGHYIACCKNKDNGQWNVFNDHNVTPISDPNKIKTNYAYVLFYKKQGIETYLTPSEQQRDSKTNKNNNNPNQVNATSSPTANDDSKVKDKHKKKQSKKDKPKKGKENGT